MANIPVRSWQKNYANGKYDKAEFDTMVEAGWYDAFCSVSSLKHRLDKLAKIVMKIQDGGKVDLDERYVWFKNNCPAVGPLYDDIRISDYSGNNEFVIQLYSQYNKEKYGSNYTVFSYKNGFEEPIFTCNDVRVLVKWLNTKEE